MKINKCLFLLIALFIGLSCEDEPKSSDVATAPGEVTTFYLIRHAEKDRSNPDDADPELTQKGLGRAMHWAEILNDVSLDAIYTTDFERTSMTAAPASVKQDITVQYYDPGSLDAETFKSEHAGQNVLVVGHSNTTPDLANRLLGENRYSQMDDGDNGSLFIIQWVGGQATATRLIFNCNCPD